MSFHVNTTSSAVNGWPSLQRTPSRSFNVQVFWSAATDHDSARAGRTFWLGASIVVNPLKSKRLTLSEDPSFAVIGLNVFGAAISPITSLPPRTPGSQSATIGFLGR